MSTANNFFRDLADIGHKLMGSPGHISGIDGYQRSGFIGRYLNKMDESRMADLQTKFAATPMGAALLGYAADKNVSIKFGFYEKNSPEVGSMTLGRYMLLNPQQSDDKLISCIAHELRHSYQYHEIKNTPAITATALPPEAAVALNRYVEADARVFQQKFCEDYAKRTGNDGPLKSMLDTNKGAELGAMGQTDAERFTGWSNFLKSSPTYDYAALSHELGKIEDREQGRVGQLAVPGMLSQEQGQQAVLGAVRKIDGAWPYPSQPGKGYLAGMGDKQLQALGAVHPPLQSEMNRIGGRYNAVYAKTNPTAAVGTQAIAPAKISSGGAAKLK